MIMICILNSQMGLLDEDIVRTGGGCKDDYMMLRRSAKQAFFVGYCLDARSCSSRFAPRRK